MTLALFLTAAACPAPPPALPRAARAPLVTPLVETDSVRPLQEEDADGDADATAWYPPTAPATALRFYCLDGDLDDGRLRDALGTVEGRLVHVPLTTGCRAGKSFVAVEVPAAAEGKAIERALRRAKVKVEPLFFTCFEGGDRELKAVPDFGLDFTTRDAIIGAAGDLRWFEHARGWTQFWYTKGKLDAEAIDDRWHKLYTPFGGARLGVPVRETFRWALADVPDERKAQKIAKKISKLDGVEAAAIEVEALELIVTVALDRLAVSLPPLPLPGVEPDGDGGVGVPRARFYTAPLLALLADEGLELETRDTASGDDG